MNGFKMLAGVSRIALLFTAAALQAQDGPETDTVYTTERIPVISALRLETPAQRLPTSLSRLESTDLLRARSRTGLYEPLQQVAGLWVMNPDNYAQDLRISVRGFGARAGFGIRGVRLLVDGIPESTPDGQAEVDLIDPGHIQNLEILRNPAAGLYGNAAGGVLLLETGWPDTLNRYEATAVAGSYGLQRYQLRGAVGKGAVQVQGSTAWQRIGGFRDHAASEGSQVNLKLRYRPADRSTRIDLLYAGVFSPIADDPGGLTLEQATADPGQARPEALTFNTGESVRQQRLGMRVNGRKNHWEWGGIAFVSTRALDNRLPFRNGGMVELLRLYGGASGYAGVQTRLGGFRIRSRLGLDVALQQDDRSRFENLNGSRGARTLEQTESFRNWAMYTVHEGMRGPATLLFSLRVDGIEQAVADRLPADGIQSGMQRFARLSPMAGINWQLSERHHLYGNVTSNFEAPALNELSNRPDGAGGFADLQPQQSRGVELGYKARPCPTLEAGIALYRIELEKEIVPYQLQEFPGRTFYRNAGQSHRTGVELETRWQLARRWSVLGNFTWNRFVYRNYTVNGVSYAGNRQPGVPGHFGLLEMRWQTRQVFFAVQTRFAGAIQANDANSEQTRAYLLNGLRGSWRSRRGEFEFFGGLQNLFDRRYPANVQINAAGGRYYEPGAGRNFHASIRIGARQAGMD